MNEEIAAEPLFTFEGELEFLQERLDFGDGNAFYGNPTLLPDALYLQDEIGQELIATLQIEGVDSAQARPLDGRRVQVTVELV